MNVARLLLPAVRWSAEHGFHREWDAVERALERGVGGFILFGGEAGAVRDLTAEMRRLAPHPLLIASDLERGAGQQFRGATPLPPAAALGSLDDPYTTRRAGELTGREARALGVNWVYAPVADVDLEPENPIIGTRAFGDHPSRVAEQVEQWIRGCRESGALCCAKHFPGHGRTVGDSHIERPTVANARQELEHDLIPFRAAVRAGVDAVMTAHVAYPALDPSAMPATLSAPMLQQLLRRDLGFGGLVVTDALVMEGLSGEVGEAGASVAAVEAGCDALLYPHDAEAVVAGMEAAVRDGRLARERVAEAVERVASAAGRVAGTPAAEGWGWEEDRRWVLEAAVRALTVQRGSPRLPHGPVRLVEIDDDVGGPFPPFARDAFPAALRRAEVELGENGTPLVALYADIRAWKGRPGLSASARQRVAEVTDRHPDATVVLFSHPRLAAEIPSARNLLAAWGGEGLMQEAVVAWLTGTSGGLASAAWGLIR